MISLAILAALKPALDELPEYINYVRVWTDEAAGGGPGLMLDFVWQDDQWKVKPV